MRLATLLIGMLGVTFGVISVLVFLLIGEAAGATVGPGALLRAVAGLGDAAARDAAVRTAMGAVRQSSDTERRAFAGLLACLLALLGAGLAPRFLGTSVTLLLAGAIALTLAVGWLAIVAAPILVLAALGGIALYPDDDESDTPQALAQTRARARQPPLPRDGG